jgi:hypothetical protein
MHCGDRTGVIVKPDKGQRCFEGAEIENAVSVDGTMDSGPSEGGNRRFQYFLHACVVWTTSLSERKKGEVREYANVDGLLRSLQHVNSERLSRCRRTNSLPLYFAVSGHMATPYPLYYQTGPI